MKYGKIILAVAAVLGLAAVTGGVASAQSYPSYPIWNSGTQFRPNPWGGLDTNRTTINNSFLDPYREVSRQTGPSWNVNRPVFRNGRVVGWETGREWFNPYTGQVHGETQQQTPNPWGGIDTHTTLRSAPGGGGR